MALDTWGNSESRGDPWDQHRAPPTLGVGDVAGDLIDGDTGLSSWTPDHVLP